MFPLCTVILVLIGAVRTIDIKERLYKKAIKTAEYELRLTQSIPQFKFYIASNDNRVFLEKPQSTHLLGRYKLGDFDYYAVANSDTVEVVNLSQIIQAEYRETLLSLFSTLAILLLFNYLFLFYLSYVLSLLNAEYKLGNQIKIGKWWLAEFAENAFSLNQTSFLFSESENLAKTVINNVPGMFVFVKNTQHVYLIANDSFIKSAGFNPIGLSDYETPWANTEASRFAADDDEVFKSGSKFNILEPLTTLTGTQWYLTNKILVGEDKLIGCSLNVTELVESRNRELQTRERLEEVNAIWRHDLKSSIKSALDMTYLMEDTLSECLNKTSRHELELAKQSISLAFNLVCETKTLQDMALGLNPQDITIDEALNRLKIGYYNNHQIQYIYSLAPAVIKVHASQFIDRAMRNIVDNALKYVDLNKEESKIVIGCKVINDFAVFYFKDNGIGIEQEDIDKILNGMGSAVRVNLDIPGDGFGLYSTRKILASHKAIFKIRSKINIGTTIYIKIPCRTTS